MVNAKKLNSKQRVSELQYANYVNNFFMEFYKVSDKLFIMEVREMLERDPIVRFGVEVTNLYIMARMKGFQHPKAKIQKGINNAINELKGSWYQTLRKLVSCYWYGYSFTEISFKDEVGNRKTLNQMVTYDPLNYDFVIEKNKIKEVYYKSGEGIHVPYDCGIHLVVGEDCNFDVLHGSGRCNAALPYWELHKILMPVLSLAAQRQATPILVKKTETGDDVILINEETGQPEIDAETNEPMLVKKGWDSIQQLVKLGSAGVTAIDISDDLYAVDFSVNHEFLLGLIKYCEQARMNAMLIPSTLFTITNNGVGDAGLSQIHLEVFIKMIISMAEFLEQEIIEKLIRPLIIYNYGEQTYYGNFLIDRSDANLLELAKISIEAGNKIPAIVDKGMLNDLRNMLGFQPLEEGEIIEDAA
jgi:hypothetical protein